MSDTAAISNTDGNVSSLIHDNLLNVNRLMFDLYRSGNDTLRYNVYHL